MKKTKLLTSIAALALVVGLGGCGGNSVTVISEDSTEVLAFIAERGAAIDSWTGIDGIWDTHYDYYLDMSGYGLESDWYDYLDSFSVVEIEQAVVKDGVLTGVWEETITDYEGDTVIGEYVEGDNYWLNYYGYVIPSTATAEGVTGLEYFTEDLVYLIEDSESGVLPLFEAYNEAIVSGNPYYADFEISGKLEESKDGTHTAQVRLSYDYEGYIAEYGTYTDAGFMDILFEYDADDELARFEYTYDDTVVWNEGEETDLCTQTIVYAPYDGEVARPAWVD